MLVTTRYNGFSLLRHLDTGLHKLSGFCNRPKAIEMAPVVNTLASRMGADIGVFFHLGGENHRRQIGGCSPLLRDSHQERVLCIFLGKIETKLGDAKNPTISGDSRFDLANEVLLQIGIADLRTNGSRPDSRGGYSILALQTLSKSIG